MQGLALSETKLGTGREHQGTQRRSTVRSPRKKYTNSEFLSLILGCFTAILPTGPRSENMLLDV